MRSARERSLGRRCDLGMTTFFGIREFCERFSFFSIAFRRRFEEQMLECSCRSSAGDELGLGTHDECFDFVQQLVGSILQNELGLIFDRDQFFQFSFADEHATGQNANPVANFLDLREQM